MHSRRRRARRLRLGSRIDQTHFPFLHPDTVDTPEYARSRLSASTENNQVVIKRQLKNAPPTAVYGKPADIMHKRVDRTSEARFVSPALHVAFAEIIDPSPDDGNFAASTLGLDSKKVWPDADPFSRTIFRLGIRMSLAIGAAIHECGGARMGDDPSMSVLNQHNQSWDVPNLFVTDASCYVSNGAVGPTLTIMALTARACDFIAREHAAGAL